jgi:hypothetical protein
MINGTNVNMFPVFRLAPRVLLRTTTPKTGLNAKLNQRFGVILFNSES